MKSFYRWIDGLNEKFWTRVVNSTQLSAQSLSAYRIIFAVFLFIQTPTFGWLGKVPQALFRPPTLSLASLFNQFPAEWFFISLDLLVLVCLICLLCGIRSRVASILLIIFSLIGYNFRYSFGKIDHDILPYAVLFCLAFSGWGSSLALVPDKKIDSESPAKRLSLLAVLLCFAMITAGFEKARRWVDFDMTTSGFLSWYNQGYYSLGRTHLLAPIVSSIPPMMVEAMDYLAPALELSGFVFLLYSKRSWKLWMFIACFFHLANALLLNIPFIPNSIVYLAFIDFRRLHEVLKQYIQNTVGKSVASIGVIVLVFFRLNFTFELYPLENMMSPREETFTTLLVAVSIWSVVLILIAREAFFQREQEFLLHSTEIHEY